MRKYFLSIFIVLFLSFDCYAAILSGSISGLLGCETPSPPTNVSVSLSSDTTFTVTWTKSAEATNYDVKYGTSSGSYTTTVSNVGDVATYEATGLTEFSPYYIVIVAKNSCGSSNNSSEVKNIWVGKVGIWKLASQTWTDSSGSGYTLTSVNSVGQVTGHDSTANAASGYTASSSQRLYIGDNAGLSITGSITISAWIYWTGTGTQVFMDKCSSQYSYYFLINSNNLVAALSSDGSNLVYASGSTTLSTSTWYHVALVYNGTDIRLYLNGSLDSNGSSNPQSYSSGIYDNASDLSIGGQAGANFFTGRVDDVGIWNTSKTATEISYLNQLGDNFVK